MRHLFVVVFILFGLVGQTACSKSKTPLQAEGGAAGKRGPEVNTDLTGGNQGYLHSERTGGNQGKRPAINTEKTAGDQGRGPRRRRY